MKYQTWMKVGSAGPILREWGKKENAETYKRQKKMKSLSRTKINDEYVEEGIQESTESKNPKRRHHTRLLEKEAD